jgi:pimeloyl-ACP methyl ester carboxylesterase
MGVQVILDFALDHPERVAGLVPVCGSYGRPLDTFHGNNGLGLAFPYLHGVVRRFPRGAQRFWTSIAGLDLAYAIASTLEVNGRAIQRSDFQPYFDHLAAMDVRVFMRVLDSVRDHSVEDRLPQLTRPTLIVAGDRDTFTPVHLSRRMAELIPDAELLVLPSGSHIAPLEHRDVLELRVQRFLGKVLTPPRHGAARATPSSAHPQ